MWVCLSIIEIGGLYEAQSHLSDLLLERVAI